MLNSLPAMVENHRFRIQLGQNKWDLNREHRSAKKKCAMTEMKRTSKTQARYERIAPLYDVMEILPECRYSSWRRHLWSIVQGPKVMEVGVGTGKNMPFYPDDVEITAIDLTPGMLKRARQRAVVLDIGVDLQIGDVQALEFPDNSFDECVATFVFCSVPDPILGLRELARVTKPGGHLLLLDHVRSGNEIAGFVMDVMNPLAVRVTGANINRQTAENVRQSGWQLELEKNMGMKGVFKMLVATNGTSLPISS
jgi:ubiquinone/menaquinone biosynthesis C-methylase UbiE